MKWLALAIGLVLTSATALNLPFERIAKGQNDFLSLYCGAKLIGTGHLHSVDAHREIAERDAGIWMPSVLFTRPPYYAALLKPLAAVLPYRAFYIGFQIVSIAALGAFLWTFRNESNLWMWALCSMPLVVLFANGQDVMFLTLAFAGAVELDRRGRSTLAGILLGCCTIKFHLFCLTPIALLSHRKWRMIASASAVTAAGVAGAMTLEGPGWILRYAEFLRRPELHPAPQPLNFHAAVGILHGGLLLEGALAALVIGSLAWLGWQRRLPFAALISLCVLGGLLISGHAGMHDYALLLGAYAITEGPLRRGFAFLLAPPVYIMVLLPGVWGLLGVGLLTSVLLLPLWEKYTRGLVLAPAPASSLS